MGDANRMPGWAVLVFLAIGLATGPGAFPARGQEYAIVALVNDEIISTLDVEARTRLLSMASNLPLTRESRRQLEPASLSELIAERLRLGEAKRQGIIVTDAKVLQNFEKIASDNKLSAARFRRLLSVREIPEETLLQRIRAELSWSQAVNRLFATEVRLTESEIRDEMAKLRDAQTSLDYHLAEIHIPIDATRSELVSLETIRDIRDRIVRQGESFDKLARAFSKSPSARRNGDLGWLRLNQFDKNLIKTITDLKEGEISAPVNTGDGWRLLRLIETRKRKKFKNDVIKQRWELVLRQAVLPLPENAGIAEERQVFAKARDLQKIMHGCEDIAYLHEQQNLPTSGDIDPIAEDQLPKEVARIIDGLETGRASLPYRIKAGIALLMICERREVPVDSDLRREARRRLRAKRLNRLAIDYIRRLRQEALIELRNPNKDKNTARRKDDNAPPEKPL